MFFFLFFKLVLDLPFQKWYNGKKRRRCDMSRADLEKLLRDFHTVSGMDISIVDRDFHTLSLTRSPAATLCAAIHKSPATIDICKESDIERLSQVKASCCPIMYTCPFGITEVIVPIIRDDEPIAYIISALGIKKGNEAEALRLSMRGCNEDGDGVNSIICEARKYTGEELDAYFNMIKMLANYIVGDDALTDENESIGPLIKRYVKNNISKKLTLKDIARNLHCSTVTLTEHFKAEFGMTINEYITRKRMDLAEKLLLTTDKPLREIATLSGFSDVEYFSRTFKKHHLISPAAWRREQRKD
jgi:AraC-like DNA-binding protein